MQGEGWEPARPDFNIIEPVFPALYRGDRSMFAFIRKPNDYIEQPIDSSLPPIYKGFLCWNSEVGARKIGGMSIHYNGMCGNHLIWGARHVFEFGARHVGNVKGQLNEFEVCVSKWARASMEDDTAVIQGATQKVIAATKDEVIDILFGKRKFKLTRKVIDAAYDAVVPEQDGDPRTVWGMVQGLTRYSQTLANADTRLEVDKSAGKILDSLDSF
jgi:hypothetical protein